MSDTIKLNTFPDSAQEALALLYVQSQKLEGKTPAELQGMYYDAYHELRKDYNERRASGWFTSQLEDLRSHT